jgi:hypothetical protein
MSLSKAHIIAQLQKEILPLQGYKPAAKGALFDSRLGPIKHAFPNSTFPLGAVHEFFCTSQEDTSATHGFIAGILSSLVRDSSVLLWIGSQLIFPPALQADGPERIEQEWWIQEGQHRDYYTVEDEEGCRYWLFRSGHYEEDYEWFIHGFFA